MQFAELKRDVNHTLEVQKERRVAGDFKHQVGILYRDDERIAICDAECHNSEWPGYTSEYER